MARRPAPKKIHYVRAIFTPNQRPQASFAELVRQALLRLPTVAETKVQIRTLGVVGVRNRHSDWRHAGRPLLIALGAGAPGEAIGTFGADVTSDHDVDAPEAPPAERAFKLADAFLLLDQDELLVCTDGGMRGYSSVAKYLRSLFDRANLPPGAQAFDLEPASNQEKRRTLEQEGVKELKIKGTLYAATQNLDGQGARGLAEIWRGFRRGFRGYLSEEADTDQQREMLAGQWGEINVTAIISPAGGSRATPVVLESLDDVGLDLVDDAPEDAEVIIKTRSDNEIRSGDVILSKKVMLLRKEQQNDLDHLEVWEELNRFRAELRQIGAWQR